jgi:predicted cupin superfamily sugar epimerase
VTISSDRAATLRVLGDVGDVAAREPAPVTASRARSVGLSEGSPSWVTQSLVPAGSWQGARLAGGPHLPAERAWTLVSCIVTPGFDFADFEIGDREALVAEHPEHAALILALT